MAFFSLWKSFRKEKIMKTNLKIVASESVNIGHPDKTCDYIADAFLDEALSQDKNSQMAVECAIKNNKLFIYGEATTNAKIDYEKIARTILSKIGYKCNFEIIKEISEQSPDINKAVLNHKHICANDQGIVFGYATNETDEYLPLSIVIAHKLMREYEKERKNTNLFFADAKCQVSVKYENDIPTEIYSVLISVSHDKTLERKDVENFVKPILEKVLKKYKKLTKNCEFLINPSGRFTVWGSFGDSGCVGRKIVVDTYGGVGHVGGGCFSSKNATKVDRSGAYYARYIAKNIVAHKLADRCEISLSFGIGIEKPLSINIETFGTEHKKVEEVYDYVEQNFDLSIENIINELDLLKPIYKQTACYGHFGRKEFAWEKIKK